MKIINIILAVLFILFAIVQYNDPDPYRWIAFYGLVGLVSIFAIFGQYRRWVILAGLAIFIIEFVRLMPEFINWINMGAPKITGTMKTEEPHIELTREFLGLLICILALGYHYWQSIKVGQRTKAT